MLPYIRIMENTHLWRTLTMTSFIVLQTPSVYVLASGNSTSKDMSFFTQDMITGLCAGFGFIVALVALICFIWCMCCGNGCSCCKSSDTKKRKVGPSPPPGKSRPGVRATTARTTSTRVPTAQGSRRS